MRWIGLVVLVVGCGKNPGDGKADGVWNGAGDTTGGVDPGSGEAAGLYWVSAHAEGADEWVADQRFYATEFVVDLGDDAARPLSGATVTMHTRTFGDAALAEDPDRAGRYVGEMFGYDRTYSLIVEGPDGEFRATAVGPAIHAIELPEQVDAGAEVDVLWDPAGASRAVLETRDTEQPIPDTGHHVLAADALDREDLADGDEYVRLWRSEALDLSGAVPSSEFEVSIRVEEPFPAQDGGADPAAGWLDGQVQLDQDFQALDGEAFVIGWPLATSSPADDPHEAWDRIASLDVDSDGDYRLGPLTPGDWYVIAYLDADRSDAANATPAGPTNGDPYQDRTVGVDPDLTTQRDFDLQDRW